MAEWCVAVYSTQLWTKVERIYLNIYNLVARSQENRRELGID